MNEERREIYKDLLAKSDEYYRYLQEVDIINFEIEEEENE